MAHSKRFLTFLFAILLPLIVFVGLAEKGHSDPNATQLICRVPTISVELENDSFVIPLILSNLMPDDSVGGFEILVNITDPELISFDSDSSWWLLDSICMGYNGELCTLWHIDSVIELGRAMYDTTGQLTSGWEYLQARTVGANGGVLKLSGLADQLAPPFTPGIPTTSADTLIKLFAHTNGVLGDSLCDSVDIEIRLSRGETRFSNSEGDLIGCGSYEWVVDTFFFNCSEWIEDSCAAWFDTVYDSIYDCIVDTTRVILVNANAELQCCDWIPGDADGNDIYNISDAVYLIAFIFGGGLPPQPVQLAGDFDCNGIVNISDVVSIIAYIFGGAPPPWCTCNDLI